MEYFSYSKLKTYEECPRSYYFKYILGLAPKTNLAMAFGSAFHKALEVFYRENDEEKAQNAFIDQLINADIKLKPGEDIEKEGKIGLNMLSKYFTSQERPYFKVKDVEVSIQTNLKDPISGRELDIPMKGIIDLITEDDLIVDHKTASSIWKMEDIETDRQATCYLMLFESYFGRKPSGFAFNFFIKRVGEPKFDCQPTERGDGAKMYFVQYCQHIINEIRAKRFSQNKGARCRYCSFRFRCLV